MKQAKEQHSSFGNVSKNDEQNDNDNINKETSASPDSATTINAAQEKKNVSAQTEEQNSAQEQNTTQEQNIETEYTALFDERLSKANQIIKNRMIASIAVGMIPFPLIDIAALTGIQMDTVRALAILYDVKFSDDIGKTAIASLTGGLFPVATGPLFSSILKSIPVAGQLIGTLSMPVIAGASTCAVGRVFVQHFESGGTFLTFDPKKVKAYFDEEYEKGKAFAKAETEVF
ncbi:MAG: DUF697 domain-containing protein [Desulfamplus sp.]|nr:DUF697 domain-containing protein [Desulfamplus sp.]